MDKIWRDFIKEEQDKPYFARLNRWLKKEERETVLYPRKELLYKPFELTPFNDVKVIICGPEPYCLPNTADGLAFSSVYNKPVQLDNLFRKIEDELEIKCFSDDYDLSRWAKQGVFLLNAVLTVRAGKRESHRNSDWLRFTGAALRKLYEDNTPKVFIFLSLESRLIRGLVIKEENPNHLVLLGGDPVLPDFYWKDYFLPTQRFLVRSGRGTVDWR